MSTINDGGGRGEAVEAGEDNSRGCDAARVAADWQSALAEKQMTRRSVPMSLVIRRS